MTTTASRRLGIICCAFCYASLLLAGAGGAQTFFTKVNGWSDTDPPGIGWASAGDINNDGWPDAFLSSFWFTSNAIVMLQNQGDGIFADRTTVVKLDMTDRHQNAGSVFADYDSDGDLDLFMPIVMEGDLSWLTLTLEGTITMPSPARSVLLRNDRGVFRDVTAEAGLTDTLHADGAIWLDYDRDGHLDLFVSGQGGGINLEKMEAIPEAEIKHKLYKNEGDGTFTEVAEEAGLGLPLFQQNRGNAFPGGGMVAADFSNNGWPDLYMGVQQAPNRLFLSEGQGRFRDATTQEIGDSGIANGIAVGDINNDGNLDIFQAVPSVISLLDPEQSWVRFRSLMLLNLGNGEFLDVTEGVGLSELTLGQDVETPCLADFDNDGDLDLLVQMTEITETGATASHPFFLNDGDGVFTSFGGQPSVFENSLMLSIGDLDLDGFLDVMASCGCPSDNWKYFRNNGNDNHWLRVELVGVQSNRNGIGARVSATSGELRQLREIVGGLGAYQQDELIAHFGLGERTQVDQLEIRWPSGQVDILNDIPADQKIRVFEGRQSFHVIRPTIWGEVSDSLVAGSTVDFQATVRPALFEPDAQVTRVTADLRELGGPEAAPFVDAGDGTYRLESASLAVEPPNGRRSISVMVDQSTSLGPHWTQLLGTEIITVLPAEDLLIFGDALREDWQLTPALKVELDPEATAHTYRGTKALAVKSDGAWRVAYIPAEPVDLVGYEAVKFAFHPGNANATSLWLYLGGARIDLLRKDTEDVRVDLDNLSWQTIEIPFASVDLEEAIASILFTGVLNGTFYLDDIRLVAATPPLSSTAVMEGHPASLPQSLTLKQNYPNPFNSNTMIRFALPIHVDVELTIFNLAGQRVATLAQGAREAGTYTVRWDGRDDDGRALASGVYLYRMQTDDGQQVETRKLVLVR